MNTWIELAEKAEAAKCFASDTFGYNGENYEIISTPSQIRERHLWDPTSFCIPRPSGWKLKTLEQVIELEKLQIAKKMNEIEELNGKIERYKDIYQMEFGEIGFQAIAKDLDKATCPIFIVRKKD